MVRLNLQVYNLFMPRVNIRRQSAWYKDNEPLDFSPSDSQVSSCSHPHLSASTIFNRRPFAHRPTKSLQLVRCLDNTIHRFFWLADSLNCSIELNMLWREVLKRYVDSSGGLMQRANSTS